MNAGDVRAALRARYNDHRRYAIAEKWAEIDRQQAEENEAKRKAEEDRRLAMDPNAGQLTIFDVMQREEAKT